MPEVFNQWTAVTTSNTVDLPWLTEAVWVGGAGNVAAQMQDGSTGIFTGVTAGALLPIATRRILATGTMATNIVAMRLI